MNKKRVETIKNKSAKNRIVFALAIVTGVGMFPLFSACMTLEQMAPPVGDEFQKIAAQHRVHVTTLEFGREIYLSQCARCHSIEPIGRYSVERWREILPRMALETKLDQRQTDAVETYVRLARVFLDEKARTEHEIAANRKRTPDENALDSYAAPGRR